MREGNYCCCDCGLRGREVSYGGGTHVYPTDLPGVYLSIDHIVPRSRGGSSKRKNLRILCVPCNTRKGTKMLVAA